MTIQQVATGEPPRNASLLTPRVPGRTDSASAPRGPATGKSKASDARQAPGPALPSILDMGRLLRSLADSSEQLDLAHMAARAGCLDGQAADTGKDLVDDRRDVLRELALTLPAQTLGDAAVQVLIACEIVDDLETNDRTSHERADRLTRVRRAFASIFPVIVTAAGITSEEIVDGAGWIDGHVARQFPGLVP